MTDIETLRKAASLMRRERGANPFYRAVADWLGVTADYVEVVAIDGDLAGCALVVARDYLGETA